MNKRARGTGRWFLRGRVAWIQYSVRGRQVRESTGIEIDCEADEKKVEKLLRKNIGDVEAGVYRDTRRVIDESLRQSYYVDYENNERKSVRRGKEGKPLLSAVARLDKFFSGWRASEIGAYLIRKFIRDQQGRGLSNGSISRSLSALRDMFHLAVKDEKLQHVPHFPMLKESAPRQGFFERSQYDALSLAPPGYLRLPLVLGYFTAMRLGEILSLEWSQVDLV
jgi:integrase